MLFINLVQLLVNTYGKDISDCIVIREYQSGSIPESQCIWCIYQKESNAYGNIGWNNFFDTDAFGFF